MKNILYFTLLSVVLPLAWTQARAADSASPAANTTPSVSQDSAMIPWPAKIVHAEGRFVLMEKATISASTPAYGTRTLLHYGLSNSTPYPSDS